MTEFPQKQDVLGTGISRTSLTAMMDLFESPLEGRAMTVNVCNVHSVMSARRDRDLAAALDAGDISTPDGMPLVWALRSFGFKAQTRVNGTALTEQALRHGLDRGWRHFFYGSTPETLELLRARLGETYPKLEIAGTYSPPFRALTAAERATVIATIMDSGTDIVWVGLGMPKQEKWMHDMRADLPGTILVGVGAAFDFLAGTKPQAPAWMQRFGLEWLFRLATEPRRLWRRYLWNNPAYLVLWGMQLVRRRFGSTVEPG